MPNLRRRFNRHAALKWSSSARVSWTEASTQHTSWDQTRRSLIVAMRLNRTARRSLRVPPIEADIRIIPQSRRNRVRLSESMSRKRCVRTRLLRLEPHISSLGTTRLTRRPMYAFSMLMLKRGGGTLRPLAQRAYQVRRTGRLGLMSLKAGRRTRMISRIRVRTTIPRLKSADLSSSTSSGSLTCLSRTFKCPRRQLRKPSIVEQIKVRRRSLR